MSGVKREWLDGLIEIAKTIIRDGERAQAMFFLRHHGRVDVVPLERLPDKDLWSSLMRLLITSIKPDEYVFIGESWIKIFDPKKEGEKTLSKLVAMGVKRVHEFEDKTECLMIV